MICQKRLFSNLPFLPADKLIVDSYYMCHISYRKVTIKTFKNRPLVSKPGVQEGEKKGEGKRARILKPPPKARLAFTNTWGNTSRSDNYSTVLALLFRPPATSTRSVYRLSARLRVWPGGRVVEKREIRTVGREMEPTGDRCSFGVKIGVRHRNYTAGYTINSP